MKIRPLIFAFAILCALPMAQHSWAANGTFDNLSVTGSSDFQGGTNMFGTWTSGPTNFPAMTLNTASSGTVNFIGSGSAVVWQWWDFNGTSNSLSMALDQNNQLTLFNGTVPGITLSPSGTSSFAGSLMVSGTETAGTFAGSGNGLTSLPAAQLIGTLNAAVTGVLHNSGTESASFATMTTSGSANIASGGLIVTSTSTTISGSAVLTHGMMLSGTTSNGTNFDIRDSGSADSLYFTSSSNTNALTFANGYSSATESFYITPDTVNNTNTFYIAGVGRLYFGDAAHGMYALNFSHVSVFENLPGSLSCQAFTDPSNYWWSPGRYGAMLRASSGDLILTPSDGLNAITTIQGTNANPPAFTFKSYCNDTSTNASLYPFLYRFDSSKSGTNLSTTVKTHTRWDIAGSPVMVLSTSGKLGIGNSAPAYKLDVSGDINFTGNIYQNGSLVSGAGSAGTFGSLNVSGTSSAGYFSGNGSSITNLQASAVTGTFTGVNASGTIAGASMVLSNTVGAVNYSQQVVPGTAGSKLVQQILNGTSGSWQWMYASVTNQYTSANLDTTGKLTLYSSSHAPAIVFDPNTRGGELTIGSGTVTAEQLAVSGSVAAYGAVNTIGDGYMYPAAYASDQAVAIGVGSSAEAWGSLALGSDAHATANNSVAIGYNTHADGNASLILGYYSYAGGDYSLSMGLESNAGGQHSIAIGAESSASGEASLAIGGMNTTASADYASAVGAYATAAGQYSFSAGYVATAGGEYTMALGNNIYAHDYTETVLGQNNVVSTGSTDSWVATDNLFVIGNGADDSHHSNALVVKKNGDTTVSGALVMSATTGNVNTISNGGLVVTGTSVPVTVGSATVMTVVSTGTNNLLLVPQQGDLSMGAFTSGVQPPH
jgi:Head domain of trimeric autotransporter adhesin